MPQMNSMPWMFLMIFFILSLIMTWVKMYYT